MRIRFPNFARPPLDNDDNTTNDVVDYDGEKFSSFNPFKYNAANVINGPTIGTSLQSNTRTVSLRQQQMQQITNDLLASGGNRETMNKILLENREFLLEPLDDDNAVLDENMAAIYQNCRSREERYRAYDETMTARIENARNLDVKQLLIEMKEFVLSYRDK